MSFVEKSAEATMHLQLNFSQKQQKEAGGREVRVHARDLALKSDS